MFNDVFDFMFKLIVVLFNLLKPDLFVSLELFIDL